MPMDPLQIAEATASFSGKKPKKPLLSRLPSQNDIWATLERSFPELYNRGAFGAGAPYDPTGSLRGPGGIQHLSGAGRRGSSGGPGGRSGGPGGPGGSGGSGGGSFQSALQQQLNISKADAKKLFDTKLSGAIDDLAGRGLANSTTRAGLQIDASSGLTRELSRLDADAARALSEFMNQQEARKLQQGQFEQEFGLREKEFGLREKELRLQALLALQGLQ